MDTIRCSSQFQSKPYARDPEWENTKPALLFGWLLVGAWLAVSIASLNMYGFWGVPLLVATTMLATLMSFLTAKIIEESNQSYEIELTDDDIVLASFDPFKRRMTTQRMRIEEIQSAYFQNRANLLLRGNRNELQIPLWSFNGASKEVLHTLKSRGIRIIGNNDPSSHQ